MRELVFEVIQEEDGGFCARAIGEGIFTQGDTWAELRAMVLDATKGYFQDSEPQQFLIYNGTLKPQTANKGALCRLQKMRST